MSDRIQPLRKLDELTASGDQPIAVETTGQVADLTTQILEKPEGKDHYEEIVREDQSTRVILIKNGVRFVKETELVFEGQEYLMVAPEEGYESWTEKYKVNENAVYFLKLALGDCPAHLLVRVQDDRIIKGIKGDYQDTLTMMEEYGM